MKKKYSTNKLRKISKIQIVKNAPVALVIFGIIIFQLLWFISISDINITYDFSNYTEESINEKSFDTFMEDIFIYINENQINFTEASNKVLQNDTLTSQINYNRSYTITTVDQIIQAVTNETLNNVYFNQFVKQLWVTAIKFYIPEGYFQSAYINFTTKGWANIQDINAYLDLIFRNESYRLLKPLKGIKFLSSEHPLILNFSIAEFLSNLILISFDYLVEITSRILLDTEQISNNILIYFYELFRESSGLAKVHFNGIFGFISLNFDLNLDLSIILQNIMGDI